VIAGVRGLLEAIGPDWVHVQVGGITLQIYVPATSINQLGPAGSPVHLYTHLRIRDDQPVLYGFADSPSLELFLLLLGVSGIGPRHSLALLSSLGVTRLHQAIESGDITALSGVPGVGRRTASRVVLELKGKLELGQEAAAAPATVSNDQEVIEALTALGYSATEARRAVNDLNPSPDLSVEDRIRLALQRMGGG
jgi:holliday junction DNA helicase RuvA